MLVPIAGPAPVIVPNTVKKESSGENPDQGESSPAMLLTCLQTL